MSYEEEKGLEFERHDPQQPAPTGLDYGVNGCDCTTHAPEGFLTSGHRQDGEEWTCPACGQKWIHACDEAEGCSWFRVVAQQPAPPACKCGHIRDEHYMEPNYECGSCDCEGFEAQPAVPSPATASLAAHSCNNCDEDRPGLLQSCAICRGDTCVHCATRRPDDYLCRFCASQVAAVPPVAPCDHNQHNTSAFIIMSCDGCGKVVHTTGHPRCLDDFLRERAEPSASPTGYEDAVQIRNVSGELRIYLLGEFVEECYSPESAQLALRTWKHRLDVYARARDQKRDAVLGNLLEAARQRLAHERVIGTNCLCVRNCLRCRLDAYERAKELTK